MFVKAAQILEPEVRLLKLNSEAAPTLSARLRIRSMPTLLLMRSGDIIARSSGMLDTDQIVAWTRTGLSTSQAA
jgi:thioredoxin 2